MTDAAGSQKTLRFHITYILVNNVAALRAYTKHGFSIVGTAGRHAKLRNTYVDMIVVERHL